MVFDFVSRGGVCLRKQGIADKNVDKYFVYVISSSFKNWHYVGFTKNLSRRFSEHNKGFQKSTKAYKPFELIFVQIVNSRKEARDLEKYLKIRFNKESLLALLAGVAEWQTLRT